MDPEPPLSSATRKLPLICCLLAHRPKHAVGSPSLCLLASYSLPSLSGPAFAEFLYLDFLTGDPCTPMLRATSRRNQCPEYPSRPIYFTSFSGYTMLEIISLTESNYLK